MKHPKFPRSGLSEHEALNEMMEPRACEAYHHDQIIEALVAVPDELFLERLRLADDVDAILGEYRAFLMERREELESIGVERWIYTPANDYLTSAENRFADFEKAINNPPEPAYKPPANLTNK